MSFLDELLTFTPRGIAYLVAILVIVTGIVCGAVITGAVGGTACAALATVGCVMLIRMIAVDVGWTAGDEQDSREPD